MKRGRPSRAHPKFVLFRPPHKNAFLAECVFVWRALLHVGARGAAFVLASWSKHGIAVFTYLLHPFSSPTKTDDCEDTKREYKRVS